jgi:Uma2 family endonuclease
MTVALERNSALPSTLEIAPRRFTFAEFEQMSDAGLFADQHVELLDGSVFVKGMQSHRHARTIRHLNKAFMALLEGKAVVSAQLPLILLSPPPDFVEPDVALLQLPETLYNDRNPTSTDALLVLEISDSTLERDQGEKLRAYARNNVQDYWILNLHTQQLEVYREPSAEEYLLTRKHKVGQGVAPLAFPEFTLEWW